MPTAEPISFVLATVVACVGAGIFLFIVVRMVVELRGKKRLAAERPDQGQYADDVERYLGRVWILTQSWRPRLDESTNAALDQIWEEIDAAAASLHAARQRDDESAELVGRLVELESELERVIDAAQAVA